MQSIFIYGVVRDADIRHLVMPESEAHLNLAPAGLPAYATVSVENGRFSNLQPTEGQRAEGLLLSGLSNEHQARLAFFENQKGYRPQMVSVEAASGPQDAICYVSANIQERAESWRFEEWAHLQKPVCLEIVEEIMSLYEGQEAQSIAPVFSQIGVRAEAKIKAKNKNNINRIKNNFNPNDIEHISLNRPYMKYFAVEDITLKHRQFNGEMGPEISRAVFATGDAVTVLPYDPDKDMVLLVEQFRAGPYARKDQSPWVLEPIAGRIEPGASAEETAIREAKEEANLELSRLIFIGEYYPSPGAFAEYLYSYIGLCDLANAGGVYGLESEHEDIKSHILPFDVAYGAIQSGEINIGPTLLSLMALANLRSELCG